MACDPSQEPSKPVAIDLFAGAGGLSLGLERAGATVKLAVERDPRARATYDANHSCAAAPGDIDATWDVRPLLQKRGIDQVDIVAGGPPCQGWSTLGGKGNELRRERLNSCVEHFLRQVGLVRPGAVLMENVRGLAVRDGGRHLRMIEQRLEAEGYRVVFSDIVRAADHGVPQLRHRLFVVAVRHGWTGTFDLPAARAVDERVTVWDAIGDLPSLDSGRASAAYAGAASNDFQRLMRGRRRKVTWHEAPDHGDRILSILKELTGQGASRASIKSVKLTSGFHNTYCRLFADQPANAVTGSAGRPSSGRNVHPYDDRALTPREAARLQTFPDEYCFETTRWNAYEQIGNAVPPLLAEAVARPLIELVRRQQQCKAA
jgi:DNA (cytosine-5)-methyltransferase 1